MLNHKNQILAIALFLLAITGPVRAQVLQSEQKPDTAVAAPAKIEEPTEYLASDTLINPPVLLVSDNDITAYVNSHIKYPSLALDYQLSGRILVQYIIGLKGKPERIRILNPGSVKGGCEEELIRVLKGMPAWKPGTLKATGEPVLVQYNMPVDFKLDQKGTPIKTDCYDYYAKYGILLAELGYPAKAESIMKKAITFKDASNDSFYNSLKQNSGNQWNKSVCDGLQMLSKLGESKATELLKDNCK